MSNGIHGERICPRCQSPLARLRRGPLTLDACGECGGVWFDAHELEQFRQRHAGAMSFLDQSLKPRREVDPPSAPTPLCPVCRIPLVPFAFPNVPHVALDGCRQCRGLWTDHGELSQLAAAVRTAPHAAEPTGAFPCPNCGARMYPTDAQCLECGAQLMRSTPGRSRSVPEDRLLPAAEDAVEVTATAARAGARVLGVNPRDLAIFFGDLRQMLHAGIAPAKSLSNIAENSSSFVIRQIAKEAAPAVGRGERLSSQLQKRPQVFEPFVVAMVMAGEENGELDRACLQVSQHQERAFQFQQKIKQETFYPKLLIFAPLIIKVVFMAVFGSLAGGDGSFGSIVRYMMVGLASFVLPGAMVAAMWFALKWLRASPATKKAMDGFRLGLPMLGNIIQAAALTRFCRALAALYAAGVNVMRGMPLAVEACGNEAMTERLRQGLPHVEAGGRVSDLLRGAPYFPPMVLEMLVVGEETGNIDTTLNKVADYYEVEIETGLHKLTKTIGVVTFLVVAFSLFGSGGPMLAFLFIFGMLFAMDALQ